MRLSHVSLTASLLVLILAIAHLPLRAENASTQPADESDFTSLFNGEDLTHWTYSKKLGDGYQVDPQEKTLYCTRTDGGYLMTEKEFANFVLRFDFKLEPNANNGIGIRSPRDGNPAKDAMEVQILDDSGDKYAGRLQPYQYHGSVYDLFPAKQGSLKPVGEWNTQEIVVDGRRIVVRVNGQTIVDGNLDDITDPEKLAKRPGIQREAGHIVLMGHGSRVNFRNIRIKELE